MKPTLPTIPKITNPIIKRHIENIENARSIIRHNKEMIAHHENVIRKELVNGQHKNVDPDYIALGDETKM